MSGKPAARQGDMTQYGGPIVQGSAGVRIGAPTGVACSVCPGGMTSGNPVNPLLGAKVLPGETDLALPGPLPFILSRTYSSYRTRTPAPVGVFGPGWKAPSDIRLQLRDDALVLNDNGGRSIHFEPLLPGEAVYSRSESMWLVRGGKAAQPDGHTLARLWGALPPDIRLSPHLYLATNSAQGPWWILGWSERVPGAEDVLPAPLPPYRVLTGLADRFGRTLTYRREAAGDLAGEITGVTDGAGREFRLVLTTQAQRAEEARTSSLSSSDSSRPLSASAFPDTLPGTEYGPDRGIRLSAVWLMHDPAYPESLPAAPLVRYTYTEAGELLAVQSQHLNSLVYDRDYGWNDNGDLVRISGPRQTREYGYSATGRLESVRTLAPDLDIRIPYATDPAGNRLPDPELHPDSTLTVWPDNRIAEDAHYVYRHDEYGRLTEKTDRIPAGVIRTDDERTHHYHYDSQHRLVFYTRIQHGEPLVESRYLYDPLGRRMAKRVWRRERDLTGWMSLSRKPEVTWYGWDGDRLTTVQTDTTRIQTVYEPGSFTPLIRVETENGEREKAQRRSLAETLQQEGSENGHGVVFPAELVRLLDRLEEEIRADRVSSESRAWLAQCGLTVEQLARQVEPEYTPARKVHFYHCDHRGLPLALISEDGNTAWRGEYDEWGNQLNEENPHHLHQPYRLPGQQHDEESGLYYNRHRHYDPLQGRYITPDPIGLRGGWNMYQYPLNPIQVIDPMGLDAIENMTSGGLIYAVSGVPGLIAANSITNSAYQFGYDMDAIVGGAHNGAADAMRHCYLMCRMTKTFGSTIADVIGKNHEAAGDRQGQPAKERIMDLKNNTVGIACGDFSAKCSDACIEKYNTGQLFGLDGIKADNPIKAKQGSSDASNY
ncbi:TPA: RHS repeat protein [Escherichia coli]|nr:RHS repeat-associated core domain-containing protein [Escherichia coli]EHU6090570.1 RHS repeat protein [Escherichia coli]WHF86368.1 RHS repeat-associated core domain-containing protein [Escherichia coli]HCO7812372.1 RHS repeat protein [Escherichia coli]HCO7817011.1 RHS repeat protein [Escherichia coli]HCP8523699.1 RHS repeat protein [Escherichia coli]